MNLLAITIPAAQLLLALAGLCTVWRMLHGPRARDRVLAFDAFYVVAILLLLTQGVRSARTVFFEAALVMSMLGFAGSVAMAKFLLRGEVIE